MKNATVLITGGARGIGESVTRRFAREGWTVIVNYNRSGDRAEALTKEFENVTAVQADVSTDAGLRRLVSFCPDPDVLVNNAGIALVKPFDAVTRDEEEKLYATDLFAPIRLTRALAPAMISRKSGCVINVSSVFGESGGSCEVDYSAAKAGLIGFTKALAKELGPSGVRVNCVCPGVIDTEMNDDLSFEDVEALTDEIALCRLGAAEDVAGAVFFLAGEDAKYITGAVIDVNGGWNG